MTKIVKARMWAITSITSILMATGYELRQLSPSIQGIPSYGVAIISLFIGATLATFVVKFLLSFKLIRRLILGDSWIEGLWLLTTYSSNDKKNCTILPGIMHIEYKADNGEVKTVVTRYDIACRQLITTNSEVAFVREYGNIRYLNYFSINDDDAPDYSGPDYGVAFAEFSKSVPGRSPNRYEGKVVYEKEGIVRRQSARRITNIEIKKSKQKAKQEHVKDWEQMLLIEYKDELM